ncbi:hypothetical protein [Spiroplasma endosymbiont of Polydrusus formosus]|uniref:hypothetical protein n=1 Tax=Spiroplasma endosymbiont of Polydrusus formosus TaxID=3139326 RepID=UPI0035B56A4B
MIKTGKNNKKHHHKHYSHVSLQLLRACKKPRFNSVNKNTVLVASINGNFTVN